MRKFGLYLITILCSITIIFTGCNNREKELELSKDVKQQVIDEEKSAIKLEKLKELDFGIENYNPICWKDEDNIIATSIKDNKERSYTNIMIPVESDINILNINVKTSQASKLKTIEKAYCGDMGRKEFYGKFLYMKDNSLWMYNAIENSEKVIYDLTEVIKEFKEPAPAILSGQDGVKDSDIPSKIKAGFVKGSDKYVYIMSFLSEGPEAAQALRILDLSTGKVYKSSTIKGFFNPMEGYLVAWYYSKGSNKFYASSLYYGKLYEFSLENAGPVKYLKNVRGMITDVTEDGNELLLTTINSNGSDIEKYNTKSKKLTKISNNKVKSSSSNQVSAYTNIFLNANNTASYDIETVTASMDRKKLIGIEHTSYIGSYDGSSIKNVKALPIEKLDNKGNMNSIIFNSKGDKFIYSVAYYDQGEDLLKFFKTKSWIYQVK